MQDLRHAARGLRRDPAFTSAAVLTLALGLAASTVVYSLIQGVLLRPLPYPEPDRLVRVFETSARFARWPVSPLNYVDFAERAKAFTGFGAWTRVDLELSSDAKPLRLRALQASPGYFTVLGARPALGRIFEERELRGDPRVVILSHRLWQDRFGADPGVLGRVVRLDRRDFTVVGVMPAGFEHVGGDYRSLPQGEHVDAWWPLVLDAEKVNRGWHYVNVVARLAPNATVAQADADMERVAAELRLQYPDTNKGWRVTLQPLRDELVGNGTSALMLLAAAVGLLLLTACANVASLLLARATTRQPEIAMRHALGASRTRLVRLGLAEAAVLAVTSGVVGLILARLMLPALLRLLPSDFARLHAVRLDTGVLLFSFLLCGLVALALRPRSGRAGQLRRPAERASQRRQERHGQCEHAALARLHRRLRGDARLRAARRRRPACPQLRGARPDRPGLRALGRRRVRPLPPRSRVCGRRLQGGLPRPARRAAARPAGSQVSRRHDGSALERLGREHRLRHHRRSPREASRRTPASAPPAPASSRASACRSSEDASSPPPTSRERRTSSW